ncbi:hypothetical protein SISNIDRAFT_63460 [Sistotremastrum niveocremeum HHB9708]|uniref:Aminoglycoside phosphotransferase domain-containing protein n=2 Tax=Sistotremastraceae TaxID=3402574 RepID=A0A164VLI9_9AGAM|nr:hypothetical protein SISNIDRAFT_63460 [Sistotremastrum niveocremeum HHB9708]KZT41212.1 hypothetical protein SISSUDRAFT_347482 [Sistotremastrum suecicum HHB10207 ss-3]
MCSLLLLTTKMSSPAIAPQPIIDVADVLRSTISKVYQEVTDIAIRGREELRKNYAVKLADQSTVIARVASSGVPPGVLESEVATLDFLRNHTTIPTPRVLYTDLKGSDELGPFILIEKIKGTHLASVWKTLAPFEQDLVVTQLARWVVETFKLRFDSIGSLYLKPESPGEVIVGPIIEAPFYVDGRAQLPLDRGPFSSAKAYLSACTQRELDASRVTLAQNMSEGYQREYEEGRLNIERSMSLLQSLIDRCGGLDSDDPEFAPFSLDLRELGLKNLTVETDNLSKIISVADIHSFSTQPLWKCARLPSWLSQSMTNENSEEYSRLANVFRQSILNADGPDSLILKGMDLDDTRVALDDVCSYNAFQDNFILMPALESIAATLPGEEDIDGLEALLDPSTVTGRAARISLLTKGPDTLSLAMANEPLAPALDTTSEGNKQIDASEFSPKETTAQLEAAPIPPAVRRVNTEQVLVSPGVTRRFSQSQEDLRATVGKARASTPAI